MNAKLVEPDSSDEKELHEFYTLTIGHTFENNGIDDPEGAREEVGHQMKTFHSFIDTEGQSDYLLTARFDGKIVGTIACGRQNRSVKNNIPESLRELPEIKGVYVHPDHQNKGLGSLMWKTMINRLHDLNVVRACLDSGYKKSQKYWTDRIGEPQIFMKDYWGEGEHQMIWFFQIGNLYKNLPEPVRPNRDSD